MVEILLPRMKGTHEIVGTHEGNLLPERAPGACSGACSGSKIPRVYIKDLNSPISHLVLKYCKFISESGRCLNNQDTSIIGLITDIEKT